MELLEYGHICFIADVFVTYVYHSYMDSFTLYSAKTFTYILKRGYVEFGVV